MKHELFVEVALEVEKLHRERGPFAWTFESDANALVIRLRLGDTRAVSMDCSKPWDSYEERAPRHIAEVAYEELLAQMYY